MKKPLHDHAHLAALQDYYARHRVLPSYTHLLTLLGFVARSGIKKLLERLEADGMLKRTPDGDWAPTDKFFERTIAHQPIPAGAPSTSVTDGCDLISIDRYLIGNPNDTVLIKVKGDSMVNAGIHSGDLAVVQRCCKAEPGAIVAAIVDGEFTLKTLAQDKKGFFLKAANPQFAEIRPQGNLEIFGVMVGLVRKYP